MTNDPMESPEVRALVDGDPVTRYAACTALALRQHWVSPDALPQEAATARVGRCDEGLAFFIDLVDSDLYTEATADQQKMWTLGDVAELFIKPGTERPDYWELHITPNDLLMDIYIPDREKFMAGEITWDQVVAPSSHVRKVVRKTTDGWSVEALVPWAAFDAAVAPEAGAIWQIAVCRYNCNGGLENRELSSTAAFTEAGFHRYE